MKKLLGGLWGLGERSAGGNDLMGKPELISCAVGNLTAILSFV